MQNFDINLASRGDRFIAHFLDYLIVVFGLILSVLLIVSSEKVGGIFGGLIRLSGSLSIFVFVFYRLCADGLEGGQSYGKRVMKICVIDATSGKPCTFTKSLLRQIPSAFLGIIDAVFIFTEMRQRLGDLVANTIVVTKYPRDRNY
jgi:uncharacterized RDD family membrane protein YckC